MLALMATAALTLDLTGGNGDETVELTGACDGPGVRRVPAVQCCGVDLLACSVYGNGAERSFGIAAVARGRWRRWRQRGERAG